VIDVVSDGTGAREVEVGMSQQLPSALPVLPLRETVPFPDTLTPLAIGQERSVALVNDVLAGNRMLVMAASRQPDLDEPGPDELYDVGVVGVIARMLKVPDGTLRLLVQGAQRRRPTSSPRSPRCPTSSRRARS
jgi:ATP-dependent Lon protease